MIKLLIAGYHGYGNCGDEATLLAMTTNIRKIADDVEITAISYRPEETKKEYDINSVQRFNAFELLKAIIKNDIVLSGGGTLIQNNTSTRSLIYYLAIIKAAKFFGKRVMLYANGIGPVTGNFNRKLVKIVVNSVDLITLREKFSYDDLKDIGVDKPDIYVTADAAFTIQGISDKEAEAILEKEGVPTEKEIVGVCIRNWNKSEYGENYVKELAKVCDRQVREGREVLLIPMQYSKDVDISKRLAEQMQEKCSILGREYAPAQVVGIIGKLSLMIGMRLHALLFAAVKRVPMIGIIYDLKVEYYLDVLKMPKGADIRSEKLESEKVSTQIEGIFYDRQKYVDLLDERVGILIDKAEENDRLLAEQLEMIRKKKGDEK